MLLIVSCVDLRWMVMCFVFVALCDFFWRLFKKIS